jgi:hypothetical protein
MEKGSEWVIMFQATFIYIYLADVSLYVASRASSD